MKPCWPLVLALILLSGCGASYTCAPEGVEQAPPVPAGDCPAGIDYKTGRCR